MDIRYQAYKIKDLFGSEAPFTDFYEDPDTDRVTAMGGLLDIRPAYQREFVYEEPMQRAVIDSILSGDSRGFPLGTMYFSVSPEGYEVLDGQQRILSVAGFLCGKYSIFYQGKTLDWANLARLYPSAAQRVLDYELTVYICDGEPGERIEWFRTINIPGSKLTTQEIRNAIYTSAWLTDAKKAISHRTGALAKAKFNRYLNGSQNRQEWLETIFDWRSAAEGFEGKADDRINNYMKTHSTKTVARGLWNYVEDVFKWVNQVFPDFDVKTMKGIEWGELYNEYRFRQVESLAGPVAALMADYEVQNKRGIYEYLLSGEARKLNLRAFDEPTRLAKTAEQMGKCAFWDSGCLSRNEVFRADELEADHITPWSKGGKTTIDNCQMLCPSCNRQKSNH